MSTIFIYTLGRFRGSILGWGLGLVVLGGFLLRFYDTIAEQGQEIILLFSQYPQELFAFFGDITQIFTPAGYLHTEFFSYMPLIFGVFIISMGSGLLVGDEEKGIMDLVLSHPISRSRLFFGRVAAYLAAILATLAIIWVSFVISTQGTLLQKISPAKMSLPLLSLAGLLILFGTLGLLLSLFLPSQRSSTMVSSLVLFASFFITGMASIEPDLETANHFSPFRYYQGGNALNEMNWGWLALLFGLSALMTLLAWWRFERRDIRVAGEGGWRLFLRRAAKT